MESNRESIAQTSLKFSGLFESELLTELLLRFWQHPHAADQEFRGDLLEAAAEALHSSIGGSVLFNELAPRNVNLVAAIWYAEVNSLPEPTLANEAELAERQAWLGRVRHALPSCFCNPDRLI